MAKALLMIVLTTVLQNSLQVSINTECHPDKNKGIVCLYKDAGTYITEENLSFGNPKGLRSYSERTDDSKSTIDESISTSYEGIRNVAEKNDNLKTADKEKSEYLRNFHLQNDEFYKDESVKFESSEKKRDVSLAMEKFENEDVSSKRAENLRNFPESADISDSESEFHNHKYLREPKKVNEGSIKYDSYEKIKNKLEKGKWFIVPKSQSNLEKRVLPFIILEIVASSVISYGIGELVKKG